MRAGWILWICGVALSATLPAGGGDTAASTAKDGSKPPAVWPGWRGPLQNGHAGDDAVPLEWGSEKNLKWKIDLPGQGNSSPVVWGDKVFLTAATKDGSERWLICLDRRKGSILWKETVAKNLPPEPLHAWNTHASASCAADGERVYCYFGNAGVFCYDFQGKLLWKEGLGKLGCSTGWGIGGSSPVLFEDLVIVNGDHGGEGKQKDRQRGDRGGQEIDFGPSYLWAFNKKTGRLEWKIERNQGMSWGTPVVLNTPKGRTELVLNGPHGVWAYDPRTGKELWRVVGRESQELFGEIMPVWGGGKIFVHTGRPGPIWAIRMDGSGDISQTHLEWAVKCGGRIVSSPCLVGDRLFQVDRQGIASCLEAGSGKEQWRKRLEGEFSSSFILVCGKLIILNDRGTAYVIEPGNEFKLLHTNKLPDNEWYRASPAVVDGQILIRSDRRLYCIAR